MSFAVEKLHPSFAVRVLDVDLSKGFDAAISAEVGRTIAEHGVAVFPNTRPLTDEQHMALSEPLGPIERKSLFKVEGRDRSRISVPGIVDVSNLDPDGNILAVDARLRAFRLGDRLWHTDMSFHDNRATFSLLSAHAVPPRDGNTEFADMRVAYAGLPDSMKARVEGLVAEHSIWHSRLAAGFPEPTAAELASRPPVQHELVHVHAPTGRKSLYIASHASHIVGMPIDEGRALLRELTAFATQPAFVYSHAWQVGELVGWDNMAMMHRGTDFEDTVYKRDMRRTTIREREVVG
jgi:alpha-ketoglutarate-dependent 2,4-dichlorophenoxyacetate dioxygenase